METSSSSSSTMEEQQMQRPFPDTTTTTLITEVKGGGGSGGASTSDNIDSSSSGSNGNAPFYLYKSVYEGRNNNNSNDISEAILSPNFKKEGKKIIVVSRKCNAVAQLTAYWHVKGVLTNMKYDPKLLNDNETLKIVVDYVENYTKLADVSFWKKLTMDQRIATCKYFVLYLDVSNEKQIWLPARLSEVFVLLSGEATTQGPDGKLHAVAHGEVFGNIGQFNKVFDRDARDLFTVSGGSSKSAPYQLNRCTFIRLGYDDLLNKIVSPPVPPPNFLAMEDDCPIDEKLIKKINRLAKGVLMPELYEFLVRHEIIPQNPAAKSFGYIHTANINRYIELSKRDSKLIFILIEGVVKFELNKENMGGNKNLDNKLVCSHKGEKDMAVSVKRTSMPLMIVDTGSFFSLQESCFMVGRDGDVELSRTTPFSGQSSRDASRKKKKKLPAAANKDLYSVRMVFERDSLYLCVPDDILRSALRTLANKSPLADFVRTQLFQINTSVLERINHFLPWITGNINWTLPAEKNKKLSALALEGLNSNNNNISSSNNNSNNNNPNMSRSLSLVNLPPIPALKPASPMKEFLYA